MALKTYLLTIEYDEETDEIEYIQEEIVDPCELKESAVVNTLTEQDYWDKDSMEIIRKFYHGEIGES